MADFAPFESSPIRVKSVSVALGDSCKLSYASNHNAWQLSQMSTETTAPECPSRVNAVMKTLQFGQFMPLIFSCNLHPPPSILHRAALESRSCVLSMC